MIAALALTLALQTTAAVGPALALQTTAAVGPTLAELLAEAVDLRTPGERATAARALAKRRDVPLADWLAAMRGFGPLAVSEALPCGASVHTVELLVDGGRQPTELHVYVPASYDPRSPAPLLCVFHGTGGSGRGQHGMWRAIADELGLLVLAPTDAGANEGYRFSAEERESALAALRWMRRRFNVDEDRIFLTGISRGGHLAWDLALRHPDLCAGIAPMIGGPRAQLRLGQNNMRYLENVAHLPIRDLQGALDDPGLVTNVRQAFDALRRFGATDAELIEFPELGHSFDPSAVDWPAFFGAARRDPDPVRVVLRATRAPARAAWLELARLDQGVDENFTPEVDAHEWNALDEAGRRAWLTEQADERTARCEVRRSGRGRFHVLGDKVKAIRLLLTVDQVDEDGGVHVTFGKARVEKQLRPSAEVLLAEFVERFDRSFLPLYEVEVKAR